MSTDPIRVALLARPGPACDRLRAVIDEAGAACVIQGDPNGMEAAELAAGAPQLVLVALEPQIEDALERFDDVLFDPGVDVVYEEAELAAGREGWEVARWQRHLVAKLQRHRNVLPPGHEPEDEAAEAAGTIEALETAEIVDAVEAVGTADPAPAAEVPDASSPFDPVLAEGDDEFEAPVAPEDLPNFEWSAEPGLQEGSVAPRAPGAIGDGGGTVEPVLADPEPGPGAESTPGIPEALSLVDDESTTTAAKSPGDVAASGRFERDLQMLESRISGLELVQDASPAPGSTDGGLVVLAGIGGPDAVRQLLGALPSGLPRPVLVRQQLDGARYDKLVAQMQRVSTLPVVLAEAGGPLSAGVVHIVPPDLGVESGPDGPRFKSGAELLGVLPPADSAVVLLSGSDASVVDGLMKERLAGALVLGQVAEGCYDPAASQALGNRGGETDTPVQLAARIAARWPVDGEPA